jgi:hypothetical protein
MPTKYADDDENVYITAALQAALSHASPKQRTKAREAFERYMRGCDKVSTADGQSIAYYIHEEVDERIAHLLKTSPHAKDVKCRKGCAHCCAMYVGISPEEGKLLRSIAVGQRIEIDEARLARQAEKTEETWLELSDEDRRCVFLAEDLSCRVYSSRPTGCRKYLVTSDPDLCDVRKHPGGDVGVLISTDVEIMQSAVMTYFGKGNDNMAAVLLAVKGQP